MDSPGSSEKLSHTPPQLERELGNLAMSDDADAQHRANLIFLSYRLSQGGIGTQNRLLLHVEENFHPNLMDQSQVRDVAQRMIGRYFLNQKLHPATAIPWEDDSPEASIKTDLIVNNELTGLFERFEDRSQIDTFSSDLIGIAQSVIVMDTDYLSRPGGRAGDSKDLKIVVSPYTRDPYDSLFIKYAVLGESTHATEYDEIFGRLASPNIIEQFDQYSLKQLRYVVETYGQYHPETLSDIRLQNIKQLCEEQLRARRS